jgi:ABC-type transporter Mla maintaining outer membrane lipid asymmetry permease subunit MlaE
MRALLFSVSPLFRLIGFHFNSQAITYFWVLKDRIEVVVDAPKHVKDNVLQISDVVNLWIIFAIVSGSLLGFSIGYLFIYQLTNLTRNITTVEEMILSKVKEKSPFDRGSFRYFYCH